MLSLFANSLVLAGVVILVGSLLPVRRLMVQLATGPMRRRWTLLVGLILLFILGYLTYAAVFWNRPSAWADLIVPVIFFCGAWFVWLTCWLALQTVIDVRYLARLEHEGITDALTGLYNRRYLDRRLEEEFARAQRHALPLAILLLDIDHFKRINDTYGHPVGDQVLSALGRLTLKTLRTSDIAARYGGEEFLVIAFSTSADAAAALAERWRQWVESHALALAGATSPEQAIRVTASVGVAALGPEVDSVRKLVERADQALYRAKQAGRNRVVVDAGPAERSTES